MKAQFEAAQYVHEEAKVFRHNAKIEVRGACRFKIGFYFVEKLNFKFGSIFLIAFAGHIGVKRRSHGQTW